MGVFKGLKELARGIGITSKHLGRHAITIQYPEERWEIPERSRGIVVLLSDKKTGELNCTSCMLCMRACPTAAIMIEAPRGEDKKRHLKSFVVDHGLCCFCGLCEEACNFCAIKMATKYEFSTLNKDDLVWDMKKLQEMGSDVDYIDTRKKKKPKTAVEPADDAEKKPPAKTDGTEDKKESPPEPKPGDAGKDAKPDDSSDEEKE